MMKMMILAPRRSGMSHAEFRSYVTEIHGPLVRSVPEVARDIRHYHYNFPVHGAADPAFGHPLADHLDIVTQGWFDSREAQLANMAEPRYLEIVRPDEQRFAGPGAVMHYTHEARVSGGEGLVPGSKIFYFRRRRADLTREEFQQTWRTRFFDVFSANRALPGIAGKYIQNHSLSEAEHPDGGNTKYFDVIDELWLRKPDALERLRDDVGSTAEVQRLEAELLEPAFTRALVTETVVNIP
jgi:hypothetical protein